jgi:hypothetical protein
VSDEPGVDGRTWAAYGEQLDANFRMRMHGQSGYLTRAFVKVDDSGQRWPCGLSNAEAQRLRDEVQRCLWDELRLDLSVEKTHVTHVNDGFDFLGFHLRRYVGPAGAAVIAEPLRARQLSKPQSRDKRWARGIRAGIPASQTA